MFLKYISVPVFLTSVALGLFLTYIIGADMKTIYVFPTPDNVGSIQYKDYADNCYTYQQEMVACGDDYKEIPVQYNNGDELSNGNDNRQSSIIPFSK